MTEGSIPQAAKSNAEGSASIQARALAVQLTSRRLWSSTSIPGSLAGAMVPVAAGMTVRRRAEPRQGPIAASSSRSCSLERPVGAVTVRLDPAPAAETVAAGDSGDVADPGRTHHLVPARRAGEITARLGVEASGRVWAAGEEVLRRIVAPCVLELQRSRDCRAKVVLGEAAE